VGYSYPWISLPQQVYNGYLFDSYEGVSASYELVSSNFSASIEAFYGVLNDDLTIGDRTIAADIKKFQGLIFSVQHNNFKLRMSTHKGNVSVDLPDLNQFARFLTQASYLREAESLETSGKVEVNQLSVNYDDLDYFIKSEFVQIKSPILVFPETFSYYLSAGYIISPLTFHATYASNTADYGKLNSSIPSGLAPQIDALAQGYTSIFESLDRVDLDSLSVGVRWDFRPGMAFKADITHLRGKSGQRSFFAITQPADFDYRANLLLVALEWVF